MGRIDTGTLSAGLVLQPGWTIKANDDGTISGRCTFACDSAGMEERLPRRGDTHPKNKKLQAYDSEGTAGENGEATIVTQYLGLTRDPSDVRFSFIGSLSQEPIETHPEFAAEIGGTATAPMNGASFDDDGHFNGFPSVAEAISAELVGTTSYLRPGLIYRATFFTSKPSNFDLSGMTRYTSAPRGLPTGVKLPEGANWLIGPTTLEQFGIIYKVSTDYMLSGPKGWNKKVHKPATP